MNNSFTERQLHEELQKAGIFNIRLSEEEKRLGKEQLLFFVHHHPKQPLWDWSLVSFRFASILTAFVAMVSAGQLSLAAEHSFPGNFLYPVKVSVNENVHSFLKFTAERKAHWEVRRAERRLQEAEALAHKEMFDDRALSEVEILFVSHTDKVDSFTFSLLQKGKQEQAEGVRSHLYSSLLVHERMLAQTSQEFPASKVQIDKLLETVHVKIQDMEQKSLSKR